MCLSDMLRRTEVHLLVYSHEPQFVNVLYFLWQLNPAAERFIFVT